MNLLKALATVSGMTLLSRITGLARDMLQARLFGVSMGTDAFVLAFSLPNLMRRMFAEGAFSQAFVPILGEYKNKQGVERTQALINDVATLLAWTLLAVTAIGILVSPFIVLIVAPGFADEPGKFDLTVLMLRLMFPYLLFISLVALAGGILNTWARFSVPAFTPVLLNVSLLAAMIFTARYFQPPVLALCAGVFCGGVLQLAFQIPALKKLGMLPRLHPHLRRAWSDAGVRRVVRQMGPAILGVSAAQVSLVLNRVFQSFLETGSMSWLFYADRLMEFPTALLGVALGTVLLPFLSRANALENPDEYSDLLDWGLRLVLLLALPAAIALAVLATPLIATMFHQGQFAARDVAMSAHALIAYAIGLVGLIGVKVLAPGFYARQDIRTPVKISLFVLALTQLMNWALIGPLAHVGLALSIGLGACVNAGLLYAGLRRAGIYRPRPGWGWFLLKLSIALIVFGGALYWAAQQFDWIAMKAQPWHRLGALALVVLGGGALYFVLLWLTGFRPNDFRRRV